MNTFRFHNHLEDALRVSGDILIINLDSTPLLNNLIKICKAHNKILYTDVSQVSGELCFSFFNTKTLSINDLNDIWCHMSYGSTMFFSDFNERSATTSDAVIKNFMKDTVSEITSARQMIVGGKKETNLIIKCFPRIKKTQFPTTNSKITIATVFKTGGEYDVSYVNHIANSIKENVTLPYEFVCLTDHFEGYCKNVNKIIPFEHGFPKWWGKIELFRPNKFNTDRIFYMDLDTIVTKNIDNIIRYAGIFCGLRDFYHQYGLGSGLMAWCNNNPLIFQIYEKFMENPTANMNNHRFGDQEFINNVMNRNIEYIQDLFPKEIVSYKKDCVDRTNRVSIPEKAKIICFHGPPRPHQVKTPEISQYWRG